MRPSQRTLVPALVYAALSTAVVSSLGMLLVPSIALDMGVSVSSAQWTLTINLLAGAVATPVMGRLSDGPHKKRLLLVSLALILLGSVVAALAPSFEVFLVGRALQGLTYGIVPVTIALARQHVDRDRSQSAISSLSVTVATGIGVGYPLTGVIAGTLDFRAAFWFAAIFVVSAMLVVLRFIPSHVGGKQVQPPFDFPGAALLGLGLGALLLGISEGSHWGWDSGALIGVVALALVALAVWVRIELRSAHPLINLRVLRRPDVVLANATAIGLGGAMYIGLSMGSLVAQAPASTGYGMALPVIWAGWVMFPLSVGSFLANRVVRRVSRRVDLAVLLPVGAGTMAFAAAQLWLAHAELWELLCGMFLFGVGMGASYAAMPSAHRQERRGAGGRQLGELQPGAPDRRQLVRHRHRRRRDRRPLRGGRMATETGITETFEVSALVCGVVFVALVVHSRVGARRTRSAGVGAAGRGQDAVTVRR